MSILKKIGDGITWLSKWMFNIGAALIYPMIFVVMYEVVCRYFLHSPTNWGYDMTWILFGAFSYLGIAYTLADDGHVKADIFLNMMPKKVQSGLTIFGYLVFFFPLMGYMCYSCFNYFLKALSMGEKSVYTSWQPLLWPCKLIIFLSCVLTLLQGVVMFAKLIGQCFEKSEKKIEGGEQA